VIAVDRHGYEGKSEAVTEFWDLHSTHRPRAQVEALRRRDRSGFEVGFEAMGGGPRLGTPPSTRSRSAQTMMSVCRGIGLAGRATFTNREIST
jgi:hypothetical protein